MNSKTKARNYYAAAIILFQDPSAEDCEIVIELLNKAVDLYPDFSEYSIFREEVWACLLKSLDPNNDLGTYEKYLNSPAWYRKRKLIKDRDKSLCICGAKATEVHHKTYKNIGKEPLSELVMLCKKCHDREYKSYVQSNDHSQGKAYWDEFKVYVKENGNKLQLFPEPDLPTIYGIQIDGKTRKSMDRHKDGAFWLIAYRSSEELQANLRMQSSTHYKSLKKKKDSIKGKFGDSLGELEWKDGENRIGFLEHNVEHVDEADTDQEFPWLHDRLMRLYTVFKPLVLELQK